MYITIKNQQNKEGEFFLMESLDLSVKSLVTGDFSSQLVVSAVTEVISVVNEGGITFIKGINAIDIEDSEVHFKLKIEEYHKKTVELFEILSYLNVLKTKIKDNLNEQCRITLMNMNMNMNIDMIER